MALVMYGATRDALLTVCTRMFFFTDISTAGVPHVADTSHTATASSAYNGIAMPHQAPGVPLLSPGRDQRPLAGPVSATLVEERRRSS